MERIKTVLISTFPLPYEGIGSWTTELNYLLERENEIDYIICPSSIIKIEKPVQFFVKPRTFIDKIKGKFNYGNRFNPFIRGLKKVLEIEDKIILQVKDNLGLLKELLLFIKKNELRNKIYIQYHYHSFLPFISENWMIEQIDELVLLTDNSYYAIKSVTDSLALRISILSDGVDSTKFKPIGNQAEKKQLREKLSIEQNKMIFVWCSQDRKKKGLDIILSTWEKLFKNNEYIELLIFGIDRDIKMEGIKMMGKVPNQEIIAYHQASDFYLFPSLCQEGFGLSLVEAMKCGSYCISAKNGASEFILGKGTYGKLIERPHIVEDWVRAIEESIKEYNENNRLNPYLQNIPKNILDIHDWHLGYNSLLKEAKKSFNHRYYI